MQRRNAIFGDKVDSGRAIQQQGRDAHVSVMRRNVQRSESRFRRSVDDRVSAGVVFVFVLEEERRRLHVVFTRRNVKSRQLYPPFDIVFQQQVDHAFFVLL